MKLQTRLTITTALLITLASAISGYAAAYGNFTNQLSEAETALNQDAFAISHAKGQELPTALLIGSSNPTDLGIGFLDINGRYSVLQEGPNVRRSAPSQDLLLSASGKSLPRTGPNHVGYLLRTISMPDSEYLVLTLSTATIREGYAENLRLVMGFTVIAAFLACVFVWFFIRRDLRGIRRLILEARQIASGARTVFETPRGTERSLVGTDEVTQLSESLASMVTQLQDSKIEMQRFLGDASHELRTPLTVIRGYLELMADSKARNDQAFASKSVSKMTAEVLRMQQIIDDLLLLAELGSASVIHDKIPVQLDEMVAGELENLRQLQPRRPMVENLDAGLVEADPHLIAQLLSNLFGNIRRHTDSTCEVEVHLVTKAGQVVLTVDDAGPGLSAEAYAKGIGNFERFDPSRSRANGGSGLGMSLMAGIVQKHGGTIELKPSYLGGLRTEIRLPALATGV